MKNKNPTPVLISGSSPDDALYVEMPSSWMEAHPWFNDWPEEIYAGRHIAGFGEKIKFCYLPEGKGC